MIWQVWRLEPTVRGGTLAEVGRIHLMLHAYNIKENVSYTENSRILVVEMFINTKWPK